MRRFVFFAAIELQGDPQIELVNKHLTELLSSFAHVENNRHMLASFANIYTIAELAPVDMPARPDGNVRTINTGSKAKN